MRQSRTGLLAAMFAALATYSCTTTASRCEDYCEYRDNCLGDPPSNCTDLCEADYDDASKSCQEAFDEVVDCVAEEDLACENSCDGSGAKFLIECVGEFR